MFNKDLYDDYDSQLCEDYSVDIDAGEILTEFATVKRDRNLNICVAVNPDRHRNLKNMEYFKIYNHTDHLRATKIARIKFRAPEYVIHNNRKGVENWFLNSKDIKNMIQVLNSPSDNYPGFTTWQGLILNFNYESGDLDFEETKKNVQDNGKTLPHPDFLPIDLPIPDYQNFLFKLK